MSQDPDLLVDLGAGHASDLPPAGILGLPVSSLGTNPAAGFESVALAPEFHLQFGEVEDKSAPSGLPLNSSVDQLQLSPIAGVNNGHIALAGADWKIAPWIGLDVAAAQGGTAFDVGGPLRYKLPDTSTMLGVSAYVNFGDGWVTSVAFDDGRTQLDLRPNALVLAGDEKDSRSIDIGVSKSNLLGPDSFDVSLTRSTQLNNALLLGPQISLASATPETDVQLNYETTFDSNITLEANAGYQTNVLGQPGAKAFSVLSRAKINF
ncbi:MAG: hypothetical protein ABSD74_13550 [Rhizomicrobium sp.]